jgi:hypothetical protein
VDAISTGKPEPETTHRKHNRFHGPIFPPRLQPA